MPIPFLPMPKPRKKKIYLTVHSSLKLPFSYYDKKEIRVLKACLQPFDVYKVCTFRNVPDDDDSI